MNVNLLRLTLSALIITCYAFTQRSTFAADSTPSADIQKKLQALQIEIASKAAKLTAEVNKKLQNRSYVGSIKSRSDTQVVISTKTGDKSVNLNEYTQYITQAKASNLKTFNPGDYVATLGDVDENSVLTAKRVVKLTKDTLEKSIIWGKVLGSDSQAINIQTKNDQNLKIKTDSNTVFKFGKVAASIYDIKEGKSIVMVGFRNADSSISARFVYILPYVSYSHFKSATPSAKIASASAKIATSSPTTKR